MQDCLPQFQLPAIRGCLDHSVGFLVGLMWSFRRLRLAGGGIECPGVISLGVHVLCWAKPFRPLWSRSYAAAQAIQAREQAFVDGVAPSLHRARQDMRLSPMRIASIEDVVTSLLEPSS